MGAGKQEETLASPNGREGLGFEKLMRAKTHENVS